MDQFDFKESYQKNSGKPFEFYQVKTGVPVWKVLLMAPLLVLITFLFLVWQLFIGVGLSIFMAILMIIGAFKQK